MLGFRSTKKSTCRTHDLAFPKSALILSPPDVIDYGPSSSIALADSLMLHHRATCCTIFLAVHRLTHALQNNFCKKEQFSVTI